MMKGEATGWATLWATHALSALQKTAGFRFRVNLVRPPRIELGLRVPETLVISFSLRARGEFSITRLDFSQCWLSPFHSRLGSFRHG